MKIVESEAGEAPESWPRLGRDKRGIYWFQPASGDKWYSLTNAISSKPDGTPDVFILSKGAVVSFEQE